MAVTSTIEIAGEEREIADAYAREQCAVLNNNLNQLAYGENSGSANIFNGKIVGGLLIETGEVSDWSARITSDFIPVEPNTLYTQIAPTSAKEGRYCEYDANKNLVYFDQSGLQDTLTTKPTTKYLRISFGSEYGTTFKNDIAIIKGNATEYVPYIMSNKQLGALNDSLDVLKSDLSAVQSNTILNYESTTVDLDSLTGHPLIASVNTVATNAPTGFGGGYMIVVYAGSSSAALYQTLVDVVNNKTYRRSLYHGSWSDWSLTAN